MSFTVRFQQQRGCATRFTVAAAMTALLLSGCHHKHDDAASSSASAPTQASDASGATAGAAASAAAPTPMASTGAAGATPGSAADPANGASNEAPNGATASGSSAADADTTGKTPEVDVASLTAGAFAVGQTSDDWFRLVDGVPDSPGIQVNQNPYALMLALPGQARITSFAFTSSPQIQVTPHHIKVEYSTQAASGPWSVAYDADFPDAATVRQGVTVRATLKEPVTAGFLRLTLSSSPQDAPYGVGLSRFSALGTPGAAPDVRHVAGLYHFPLNFGSSGYVLLEQNGAGVEGCYFESAQDGGNAVHVGQVLGTIVGGIEQGGYLRFMRNDQQANASTPGIMVFSPDGKKVFSALFHGDAHAFSNVDEGAGTSVGPTKLSCNASGKAEDPVASQLEQTGHVQLYGVNFDLDQSTLRADAKPVLDRMAALLKSHGDWKIEVAGHTDTTGSDAHNVALSQARAEAVVAYLKQAGVSSTLTAKGYGSTQPLVPNTTDALRAQNRRVELVKQ